MLTGAVAAKVSWPSWVALDVGLIVVLTTFTLGYPWSPTPNQNSDNTQASSSGSTSGAGGADQQSQAAQDRELARKIRRAVVTDKSLSIYAHNIKIVAQNGVVTLKGRVHSEQEKNAVVTKATEIAGASNVKDEMSVEAKS